MARKVKNQVVATKLNLEYPVPAGPHYMLRRPGSLFSGITPLSDPEFGDMVGKFELFYVVKGFDPRNPHKIHEFEVKVRAVYKHLVGVPETLVADCGPGLSEVVDAYGSTYVKGQRINVRLAYFPEYNAGFIQPINTSVIMSDYVQRRKLARYAAMRTAH